MKNKTDQNYTTTYLVAQSPEQVFGAINNVRGWWSEQIDGQTDKLNAVFDYHYKDVHRCKIRITEMVPNKKVVWLVLANHFNFTKDATEWKGTQMVFEIGKKDGKTQLTFTHIGLVPAYECFNICTDAWSNYIAGSLKSLIETGKGNPNPYETAIKNAEAMVNADYSASFLVDKTPHEAFEAINNVRGWWIERVDGDTKKLDDEFSVQFWNVHYSKQKLIEMVPDKKVVWLITDSKLTFIKDESEWTGTKIVFDITPKGDQTEVRFTQIGLNPKVECYKDCSNAWGGYINSLKSLIETGKGKPTTLAELTK